MRKIIFILFIVLCLACTKTDNAVTPAIITRTLEGTVYLYDEFGHRQSNSYNVTVYVNDTTTDNTQAALSSTIPPSNDTTFTDSAGTYIVYDVSIGTYTLTYSKAGYGIYKHFGFSIAGSASPQTLPSVSLNEYSTTIPSNLSLTYRGNYSDDTVKITGDINIMSIAPAQRHVIIFIDTLNTVSSLSYSYSISVTVEEGSQAFSQNFYPSQQGISPGTKLYCIAYGQPYGPTNSYADPISGLTVFPGLNSNPSNMAAIIVTE